MNPTALDLAGRSLPIITIHVKKRYGSSTVCCSVTASSVDQALKLAGEGARVVFPIDGEAFFVPAEEDRRATRGPEDCEVVLRSRRVIGR